MAAGTDQDGVDWREGVPVSRRFDDPYFALSDGLAETRHVFLDGNVLSERCAHATIFRIAELGFGTGLNFLAAVELWHRIAPPDGILHFTSFELFPLSRDEMATALSVWPALDAAILLEQWPPEAPLRLGRSRLDLIFGDARETLPNWAGQADAWFLDGFAPARNPELWEPALLSEVARHTRPDGTFATYTAAGHVRRALQDAGFSVERRPGFGLKRHMTIGRLTR